MNKIIKGDCIEEMKKLPENSVDAIITDPPYGIGFMGKEWDNFKPKEIKKTTKLIHKTDYINGVPVKRKKPELVTRDSGARTSGTYDLSLSGNQKFQQWFYELSIEFIRVLKPGGFLLSFGGTRTYHRLVCGIEDAGFEIRDTIMWLYGSGFPKSLNIGKQIDKIQGNEREVVGIVDGKTSDNKNNNTFNASPRYYEGTKGKSEWEGWGTALKPAVEPIVVARKPLSEKNVALNVVKWGTGGINIDECRIGSETIATNNPEGERFKTKYKGGENITKKHTTYHQGRFPANIILDEEAGKMLGEPNRFFYCAKASKSERNFGCEDMESKTTDDGREIVSDRPHQRGASQRKNFHPTVKPIALMEYLVKLISKEGAVVLDPFLGSGTTAIACLKLSRKFIGIEKEEEYVKIAKARIKPFMEQRKLE